MTDTNLKHKLSIPVILLHFVMLTIGFLYFNPIIGFFIDRSEIRQYQLYLLLCIEISFSYYYFPYKRTLKVDKLPFILVILCSFFNIAGVFFTIEDIIEYTTPYPHSPYLQNLYNYMPVLCSIPLPTYLAGYINKKLFWTTASITISGFVLFFIWNFFIDRFLH